MVNHLRSSLFPYLKAFNVSTFKLVNRSKEQFVCPICNYSGPFRDISEQTGVRKHASCPKCGSLERHRLQYLVLQEVEKNHNFSQMSMLHFAPEPLFQKYFHHKFLQYFSADLVMKDVDFQVDLRNLPFENNTFNFIFASHVLEHIDDDQKAIGEIYRVLKPGGLAVLPVPILAKKTIEYLAPNPYEAYHVRSPGLDYFDRYSSYFNKITKFSSIEFNQKYQLFIYEDRTKWPTDEMPLREPADGEKHIDIVPVCFK